MIPGIPRIKQKSAGVAVIGVIDFPSLKRECKVDYRIDYTLQKPDTLPDNKIIPGSVGRSYSRSDQNRGSKVGLSHLRSQPDGS